MDDVVPSALQRLRAADIIRMAGLSIASLGQEYCRVGAVQATMRRGSQLLGIVDISNLANGPAASPTDTAETTEHISPEQHRYVVDVEVQSSNVWLAHCSCNPGSICQHVAALLYQWLAHPMTFITPATPATHSSSGTSPLKREEVALPSGEQKTALKSLQQPGQTAHVAVLRGPTPPGNLREILTQMGLSELRSIAREYDITPTGLNKQQLADAIIELLNQPEVVRRMAGALEKPQRQLLATLTLAGGSMTDDDLRGLFERFAFGQPDKLQGILLVLQSKGLLLRTSLNSSPQQRIGLSGSLFDLGWYVPDEVRAALHVPLPITPFTLEKGAARDTGMPRIQRVEPYSLLADLLLIGRALDGYLLKHDDEKDERNGSWRNSSFAPLRATGALPNDGAGSISSPSGLPSSSLIATLQHAVPRSSTFLRYAVRLLRLADILHKDDAGTPYLRLLPNAARLLLGPISREVACDLFELWLTQPGYDELFELQEEDLCLRCRTTPLNHPILRPGELEAENCEARQLLVALIAQAPLNEWISFPAFARFIYRLNPSFLQKRQRLYPSPHWWFEQEEGRPLQPTQMNDWMHAEGHYLARLLRGPLHWWGITDLALSGEGQLLAFRLTPMADLLLNGVEPPTTGDKRGIISHLPQGAVAESEQLYKNAGTSRSELQFHADVQEDSTSFLDVLETGELLIACTSGAWPLIRLIEDFAETSGVRNERLCYRLAPRSVAEALSRGQHPTALLRLLQQLAENDEQTGTPLTRLLAQLERWTASYGRVRLYTGVSLLEVTDTLVMRELSATTSVEEQIVQAISPTRMILKSRGTDRIVEDLKRRGQVPLLHEKE
jgi:XPB/Ssl2-like helicase family protein